MLQIDNINSDAIIALSSEWRLRPDSGRSVIYKYNLEEIVYCCLPFTVGLALSFLDGKHSIGSLIPILKKILPRMSDDDIRQLYITAIKKANETSHDFITVISSTTKAITKVNPEKFINLSISNRSCEEDPYSCSNRLDIPLQIVLMPTNVCRTSCIYCYAERRPVNQYRMLPLSRWLEIIDEMGENGIDMVVFSGGDPLLYPDIERLLERLQYWKILYLLSTKGAVSKQQAFRIGELIGDCGTIQVSIDGADPILTDRVSGLSGFCESMWSSLANLVHTGIRVRTQSVITAINYHDVPQLIRRLYSTGVANANITNYNRSFYRHKDDLFLSQEQINRLKETVDNMRKSLDYPGLKCNAGVNDPTIMSNEEKKNAWTKRNGCSGGRSGCCITPDGKIILCEQMPQDKPFVYGDVHDKSLIDVWRSKEIVEFLQVPREQFKGTACYKCNEFEQCNWQIGRCFRDAFFTYGSLYHPPPNCPHATGGFRMG